MCRSGAHCAGRLLRHGAQPPAPSHRHTGSHRHPTFCGRTRSHSRAYRHRRTACCGRSGSSASVSLRHAHPATYTHSYAQDRRGYDTAVLYGLAATLLEDGRVLVTGGQVPSGVLTAVASAEIYDPTTGRWSPTRPMFDSRRYHDAVLLEDGRVLVSGGVTGEYELSADDARLIWLGSISSAEVYDPSTETWSLVGHMPEETGGHLLEMLENGKVLAAGGLGASAALYDPTSGTWASVGEATSRDSETRLWQANALLADGKVLFIGGFDGSAQIDSVELWDPLTGLSSSTGSMIGARAQASATVLTDGKVLVTGGRGLATAEIYDPTSGAWSEAGEMATNRVGHSATLLSDGRVLVVGGGGKATEIYDPSTGDWSKAASTLERREQHTATVLKDGRVLVAGGAIGTSGREFPDTSAEVYDPSTDTWTPSTEAAR